MNTCPSCSRLYPNDVEICRVDEQKLVSTEDTKPPSDPKDPRVGSDVVSGRYQIWRVIAVGGMGRVYEALDREEGRNVALKILHDEVVKDEVALERFKREFEVSAVLPHEHVVEVYAFEHDPDGKYIIVMEYLEGEELRMLLRREKVLRPERVVRILSQLAIGLSAAHERKIVHRDLKPDNVFLCASGEGDMVKILDFGSVRDNSEGAKKLTAVGTTIGSPFYMSPEQAQGLASLDHRADVWSLAAITYEALTGKVPFDGPTGPKILLGIMTKPHKLPSEVGRDKGVPRTLDKVMDDALAKDPAARIPDVATLAERVGHAFGLKGDHLEWAKTKESDLRERIERGLPAALERLEAEHGGAADLSAMDAAFAGRAAMVSAAALESPPEAPSRPAWLIPAIVATVLVVGALLAFFATR